MLCNSIVFSEECLHCSSFAKNNSAYLFTLYYEHLVKVEGADITGLYSFLNVLSSTDRLRNSLAVGVK